MKALIFIFLAFIILSCGACNNPFEDDQHSGFFRRSFETRAFEFCESSGIWWVISDVTDSQYIKCGVSYGDSAHAKLRDATSELGSYSRLGGYDREFYITRVLEMRPPRTGDCD